MNHKPKPEPHPDLNQLIQLAKSPAGKQFIAKVQAQNPELFRQATTNISQGNMEMAKTSILEIMKDPNIAQLLQQLGGSGHE